MALGCATPSRHVPDTVRWPRRHVSSAHAASDRVRAHSGDVVRLDTNWLACWNIGCRRTTARSPQRPRRVQQPERTPRRYVTRWSQRHPSAGCGNGVLFSVRQRRRNALVCCNGSLRNAQARRQWAVTPDRGWACVSHGASCPPSPGQACGIRSYYPTRHSPAEWQLWQPLARILVRLDAQTECGACPPTRTRDLRTGWVLPPTFRRFGRARALHFIAGSRACATMDMLAACAV